MSPGEVFVPPQADAQGEPPKTLAQLRAARDVAAAELAGLRAEAAIRALDASDRSRGTAPSDLNVSPSEFAHAATEDRGAMSGLDGIHAEIEACAATLGRGEPDAGHRRARSIRRHLLGRLCQALDISLGLVSVAEAELDGYDRGTERLIGEFGGALERRRAELWHAREQVAGLPPGDDKAGKSDALESLRDLIVREETALRQLVAERAETRAELERWAVERATTALEHARSAAALLEAEVPSLEVMASGLIHGRPLRASVPPTGYEPAGVCRRCGCTEQAACPGGCALADETRTLCVRCMVAGDAGGEEARAAPAGA